MPNGEQGIDDVGILIMISLRACLSIRVVH
jgi:hypothetical protein